jgi:hypothetical protein
MTVGSTARTGSRYLVRHLKIQRKKVVSARNTSELPYKIKDLPQAKKLRPRGPKRIAREIRESKLR